MKKLALGRLGLLACFIPDHGVSFGIAKAEDGR